MVTYIWAVTYFFVWSVNVSEFRSPFVLVFVILFAIQISFINGNYFRGRVLIRFAIFIAMILLSIFDRYLKVHMLNLELMGTARG